MADRRKVGKGPEATQLTKIVWRESRRSAWGRGARTRSPGTLFRCGAGGAPLHPTGNQELPNVSQDTAGPEMRGETVRIRVGQDPERLESRSVSRRLGSNTGAGPRSQVPLCVGAFLAHGRAPTMLNE